MFAPVEDRDEPGAGFTHKIGDIVRIETPELGALVNRVTTSDKAPPWTFGVRRPGPEPRRARVAGEGLKNLHRPVAGQPDRSRGPVGLDMSFLQALQVLDQSFPLTRLQTTADHARFRRAGLDVLELMAGIQVAGDAGVRRGGAGSAVGLVAELLRVVLVAAQAEGLRDAPRPASAGRRWSGPNRYAGTADRPDAVERPGLVGRLPPEGSSAGSRSACSDPPGWCRVRRTRTRPRAEPYSPERRRSLRWWWRCQPTSAAPWCTGPKDRSRRRAAPGPDGFAGCWPVRDRCRPWRSGSG